MVYSLPFFDKKSAIHTEKGPHSESWVDKGRKFYNKSVKTSLEDMFVFERFIKTVKNLISKHMKTISKIVYIDNLDDIFNKYNNENHKTIKMKPIDVTLNFYIYFDVESNEECFKFKVGNYIGILKYENIFAKFYTTNCSEEVFIINLLKNI